MLHNVRQARIMFTKETHWFWRNINWEHSIIRLKIWHNLNTFSSSRLRSFSLAFSCKCAMYSSKISLPKLSSPIDLIQIRQGKIIRSRRVEIRIMHFQQSASRPVFLAFFKKWFAIFPIRRRSYLLKGGIKTSHIAWSNQSFQCPAKHCRKKDISIPLHQSMQFSTFLERNRSLKSSARRWRFLASFSSFSFILSSSSSNTSCKQYHHQIHEECVCVCARTCVTRIKV